MVELESMEQQLQNPGVSWLGTLLMPNPHYVVSRPRLLPSIISQQHPVRHDKLP